MEAATLGLADYAVIGLTMCASVGIGLYYRFSGGRQKTTQVLFLLYKSAMYFYMNQELNLGLIILLLSKEYFSANKSMGVTTISIALMVSFMSAITLLGVSAENYSFGTQFVVINLGYLIGTPLVCYGYLPVFFNLQVISAYEVHISKISIVIIIFYILNNARFFFSVFRQAIRLRSSSLS